MTQDEAVIEAVADELNQMPQLGLGLIPSRWAARAAIRAYLSALDKAGFAVVRKEPDKPMLWAGTDAANSGKWAGAIYGTMVSASPHPPGSAEGVKE